MLSMRKIILNGIIAITTFISAGVVCGNESQTFLNTSGHNERSQLDTELSNSTYQTVIVKILANSSNDVANHKNLRLLQYDEDEEKNPVFNDTVAGTSAEVATNNSEVAVIKDGDRKVEDISEKFHVKRSVDIKSADEWLHHPSTEGYSTVKDDGAGGIDRRLSIGAENRPGSKFVANGKFSSKRIWTLWENNPSAFQAKMRYLIRLKTRIKHHLLHRVPTKENKNSLPDELIKIFHKLINQSESLIVVSVHHFDRALTVGYGSIELIKKNCEDRLQTLRELLIEEDRLLNNIVNLQKLSEQSLAKQNMTQLSNFWYSIMENIKEAADDLESELADPAFDTMLKSGNKPNVETVIKVHDGNSEMDKRNAEAGHGSDESFQEDYLRLVDSQNNQYVMSKSRDTTVPTEDASLVKDIINVILASSVFVLMCRICGLPVMFGYILTGVILGPAGFNLIKNLVQMETLGEFGVFFILFSVGLEFSLEKLRRLWKAAVITISLLLTGMIMISLAASWLFNFGSKQCSFVAICVSLSSTPLAVKFLEGGAHKDLIDADPGPTLLSVLVVQDIILGILIALLPAIATQTDAFSLLTLMNLLSPLLISTTILLTLTLLTTTVIKYVVNYLMSIIHDELFVLANISWAFVLLLLTDYLKLSMELGCFVAGVIMSSHKHHHQISEHIETAISPIKDFFSCLFFASIGLHVYPSFLTYEVTLLVPATLLVVSIKFFFTLTTLTVVQRKPKEISLLVSAGLAPVSEFSFVLGSRARALGIISREIYLLILSVTMLSLLSAPLIWKFALKKARISMRHVI